MKPLLAWAIWLMASLLFAKQQCTCFDLEASSVAGRKAAPSMSRRHLVQKTRQSALAMTEMDNAMMVEPSNITDIPHFLLDPSAADDPTPHRVILIYEEGFEEEMALDLDFVDDIVSGKNLSDPLPPFAAQDGLIFEFHHKIKEWNLFALNASVSILFWLLEKDASSVKAIEIDPIRTISSQPFQSMAEILNEGRVAEQLSHEVRRLTTWEEAFWAVDMVQARDLWLLDDAPSYGASGDGVTICIIDSGVDDSNAAFRSDTFGSSASLVGNLNWRSSGEEDCYHGTHVAGILAADGWLNETIGVAYNANISVVRVLDEQCNPVYASDLIAASMECFSFGAQIINIGLSGEVPSLYEESVMKNLTETYDMLLVAAAGDEGGTADLYPAAYESVMSTVSIDKFGEVSVSSQSNYNVAISAPGVDVPTVDAGNGALAFVSGTDMAAAYVSGAAALLHSALAWTSFSEIRAAIEKTAQRKGPENVDADGNGSRNNIYGHGILKAKAAYDCLLQPATKCIPFEKPFTKHCENDPIDWHDIDGPAFNCNWYAEYDRCAVLGDKFAKWDDISASMACCACGGGIWIAEASPTLAPIFVPPLEGDSNPAHSPSPVPSPAPSRAPIFASNCVDDPFDWHAAAADILFNCEWYSLVDSDRQCDLFGAIHNGNGVTASNACCTCGGGLRPDEGQDTTKPWMLVSQEDFKTDTDRERQWGEWSSRNENADFRERMEFTGLVLRGSILETGSIQHSPLGATGISQLRLSLNFEAKNLEPNEGFVVEKSVDSGATWEPVVEFLLTQEDFHPYIVGIENQIKYSNTQVIIDVAGDEEFILISIQMKASYIRDVVFIDYVKLESR